MTGPTDAEVAAGIVYANNDVGTPRGSGLVSRVLPPAPDDYEARLRLARRGLRGLLTSSRPEVAEAARARLGRDRASTAAAFPPPLPYVRKHTAIVDPLA